MPLVFSQLSTDAQRIYHALQTVIDPEIGENLIDLGLIYDIAVNSGVVRVTFTMTSYACPMSEMVIENIHDTVSKVLNAGEELELDLVWEPAWEPSMMNAEAKRRLGWD